MGRSEKALKNVSVGLQNKFLLFAFAFFTRTVFVRLLGAEYTGINSLFKNILSVLSLAELGIGNVFMYYLYPALSEKDEKKIIGLVYDFRKVYIVIAVVITLLGIAFIPFLGIIVSGGYSFFEVVTYYSLYLFNSVASYFVIYRTMVISADQQNYIQSKCFTYTTLVMYVLQIIYLITCKDFLGYLLIQVGCTLFYNVTLNIIAIRKYPYLLKITKRDHNSFVNEKVLFRDMKATFLFKVSDVILDQTDNIIISLLFGTIAVGYYSNYYLVITYLVDIVGTIASGLVASFGNLNVEGDKNKLYRLFKSTMTMFAVVGTLCTACYACVIQDIIPLWIGENYLMDYSVIMAIIVVFFLRMITNTVWVYRAAMGLFKEVQYVNMIAAVINIILSILLGKAWGISGVIVATALSRLLTSFWYEGRVVLKRLNKPVYEYYLKQIKDIIIAIIIVSVSLVICQRIDLGGFVNLIVKIMICVMVTLFVEYVVYRKTDEYYVFRGKIKAVFDKKRFVA